LAVKRRNGGERKGKGKQEQIDIEYRLVGKKGESEVRRGHLGV